jgi:hypothetical protein
MFNFWLQHEFIDDDRMRFNTVFVSSHDVQSAIRESFGFAVRPASALKYDVCTQQQGDSGHLYWFVISN